MFDRDRVVCIRGLSERDRHDILWSPGNPPKELPQVGRVYTIEAVVPNPWYPGQYGLLLCEIPEWKWDSDRFRKVEDIEEPRYVVVEKRIPELA